MVLQSEAAECGLACIAMISSFWGHRATLAELRRLHSISLKGVTLAALLRIGERLNLDARAVKLGLEEIGELSLPCVLHWDMNHFVVLKRKRSAQVIIHDPAAGKRHVSLSELSAHFTGVAVEFRPGALFQFTPPAKAIALSALWGRVFGLRSGLAQLLLLGIALQVCVLLAPFYLQWVTDEVLMSADRNLLLTLGVGFLTLNLIQAFIGAVRSYASTILAVDLSFQWLGNAFTHLMKLPLPFFEQRHLGDIVSRFSSLQTIQRAITSEVIEAIIDGLLTVSTLIVMVLYSGELATITAIALIGYLLLRGALLPRLREATAEQIVHAAKQQTHLIESARGIQSVRLFDGATERKSGWMSSLSDQFNADIRLAKLSIGVKAIHVVIFGSQRIIVIWLAAISVLHDRLSIGMVLAFLSYQDQFSQRGVALVDRLLQLKMLSLHAERVADILLCEPEEDQDAMPDAREVVASIEFKAVSFRYAESDPWVLHNFSLFIPHGQCIAITGPSGSGKTTLAKLMLGLMRPSQGEILVGGVPLRALGLHRQRMLSSAVMQEDQLFSGSILDNICFFDTAPDMDRIRSAAHAAALDGDIERMPMAYHTLIGDIGTGLSGGQKQRLLLARALYREPKILVLDEATSHLDMGNERAVNAAIGKLQLTRVLIAHRQETLAMATRVVVLNAGKLEHDTERPAPVVPGQSPIG